MVQLFNKYITNLINKELKLFQDEIYLYLESGNQFIYKDIANLEVCRLSQSLYKDIVISESKVTNKGEYYHKLRMPNGEIGYGVLDKSIRLFRMPNIFVKLTDYKLRENFQLEDKLNLNDYRKNLLKVQYCFMKDNILYLIINKIGKNSLGLVVNHSDVYFLNNEYESINISLEKGQKMYVNSSFEGEFVVADNQYEVKLIGFLESTNEYRVKYKNKKLWVKLNDLDISRELIFMELFKNLEKNPDYLENIDNIISIKHRINDIKNHERQNKEFKNSIYRNLLIEEDANALIQLK